MPTPGKPFDATTRNLFSLGPHDWLKLFRIKVPGRRKVEVIDAGISTVTADADKVIKIDGRPPWIIHVEFQAAYDARMAERLLRYNVLLGYRHEARVRSIVVLLRKQTGETGLTGIHEEAFPGEGAYLTFRYDVVRAWEQRAEDILAGGLATLPLVVISDVGKAGIAAALRAMADRLKAEASPDRRATLMASARALLGLRFDRSEAGEIWRRVEMDVLKIRGIEESSFYQEIMELGEARGEARGMAEGKAEEARGLLLKLGRKKFGVPGRHVLEEIEGLSDLKRLERLCERLLSVSSWDDLVRPPK
jgi:predicted transposase YdaD